MLQLEFPSPNSPSFRLSPMLDLHPSLEALPAYSFFLAPCILHGLCPQEIVIMAISLSVTVSSGPKTAAEDGLSL